VYAASILVPLEDDGVHSVGDVADRLSQEYVTIEFAVTDDEDVCGTLVEFRGDAAELADMVRTYDLTVAF
jgi:hypothetical protein